MNILMKKYSVELPIAGRAIVEVEAIGPEQAISEAMQAVTFDHVEEWDAYKHIVQGNVCYAPVHRASAEEIEAE